MKETDKAKRISEITQGLHKRGYRVDEFSWEPERESFRLVVLWQLSTGDKLKIETHLGEELVYNEQDPAGFICEYLIQKEA